MKKLMNLVLVLSAISIFTACASTTKETVKLTFETTADGPFFAGPNSLMANYEVDLSQLVEGKTFTSDQIKKVTLNSATVEIPVADSATVNYFTSASLQLVADDAPMATVAILNPIEGEGTKVALSASQEAELQDYFKQESFTVLLDWDFIEDDYRESLGTIVEMEMTFEIKN